jgi:hypothetical protein
MLLVATVYKVCYASQTVLPVAIQISFLIKKLCRAVDFTTYTAQDFITGVNLKSKNHQKYRMLFNCEIKHNFYQPLEDTPL